MNGRDGEGSTQQTSRRCLVRGGRERSWFSAPALRTALCEVGGRLAVADKDGTREPQYAYTSGRRLLVGYINVSKRMRLDAQRCARIHRGVEACASSCRLQTVRWPTHCDVRGLRVQLHCSTVGPRTTDALRQGSRASCQSMSTARHAPQAFVGNLQQELPVELWLTSVDAVDDSSATL